MTGLAVEKRNVHSNTFTPEPIGNGQWDVSGTAANVQHRDLREASALCGVADQREGSRDSAEPAIDSSQVCERLLHLVRTAEVGIQKLGSDCAAHAGAPLDGLQLFFEQLFVVELCVVPVAADEFVVRAVLDDLSVVEHGDLVGVADGRDAV